MQLLMAMGTDKEIRVNFWILSYYGYIRKQIVVLIFCTIFVLHFYVFHQTFTKSIDSNSDGMYHVGKLTETHLVTVSKGEYCEKISNVKLGRNRNECVLANARTAYRFPVKPPA